MALASRLVLLLLLATCLVSAQNETDIIKVSFIYGNLPNDLSWTYAQDLGRAFLEFSDPGVKTQYSVVGFSCGALFDEAVAEFVAAKANIVILTSGAYQPCGPSTAAKYPNVKFVCMGCNRPSDAPTNYGAVNSRMHESRYVQGVMAGLVTKTKKIGFIGSNNYGGDITDPMAMLLGALNYCPDCELHRYYIDSFFNPVRVVEAARLLIAEGCDVIGHLHDAFEWFPLAVAANISVLGHDVDQISLAPKNMITSSYYIWGPFLQTIVSSYRTNTFPQQTIVYGIRERGTGLAAFTNVPDNYAQIGYDTIRQVVATEFINSNASTMIFCGPNWDKVRQGTNYTGCLTMDQILSMSEYGTGFINHGLVPDPKPPLRFVDWGDGLSVALLALTALCILITLIAFVVTFIYVGTSVVKMSHPVFMLITFLGIFLGLGMVFTYPGKITNKSCIARTWTGGLGFALIFAPMIAKNYRLARIMSNTALISTVIPTFEFLGVVGGIIGVEVLILVLWTSISSTRLRSATHFKDDHDILICRADKQWPFLGIQLAYIIIVLLSGFILSYVNRKIARRVLFKEAQWINYTFYSSTVWFLLWALATGLLWSNHNAVFVISIVSILLLVMFVLALVVGPKLYILLWVKGGRESGSVTGSHSSDFSTDFKPDRDFNNDSM